MLRRVVWDVAARDRGSQISALRRRRGGRIGNKCCFPATSADAALSLAVHAVASSAAVPQSAPSLRRSEVARSPSRLLLINVHVSSLLCTVNDYTMRIVLTIRHEPPTFDSLTF